jgi:hypothetical protein
LATGPKPVWRPLPPAEELAVVFGGIMPVGRIVLKRISESKKLPRLKTDGARLLYTWLLAHLDVNGCFSGDAEVIKGKIFTRLKKSVKIVESYLKDLEECRLILRYENDGDKYLIVPDFKEKQPFINPDREAKPSIPLPAQDLLQTYSRLDQEDSLLNESKSKSKSKSESKSSPSQDPLKITFDWDKKKFINITDEDKLRWRDAYPSVNIDIEIRKAVEWVLSNPEKRKQKWRSFLTRWFSRTQERGGTKDGASSDKKTFDPVDRAINEAEERLRRDQH